MSADELATLEFLVDELQLEHDVARRAACARQVYLHAHRGASLAPYVARLGLVESNDYPTRRHVGWALTVHAYATDDGAAVRALLAGPHHDAALALDHRAAVGPAVIAALVEHAAGATGDVRQRTFTALARLGAAGAELAPLVPVLLDTLGTPPAGRGLKRVDLDAAARNLLRPFLAPSSPRRADVGTELRRLAGDTGSRAKAATTMLADVVAD